MSKYTTEVRFLCESLSGRTESVGYSKVNEVIAESREKIFNFDYPIFDADYRATLETKILKHYYTREICAETFGRWQLFLESRMIEIMPYYNQLYNSALIEYDIFEDVNYSRLGNKTSNEQGNQHSQDDATHSGQASQRQTVKDDTTTRVQNENWTMYSDTPQGTVSDLDDNTYLTNATKVTDDGTNTVDGTVVTTGNTTDSYNDTRENESTHEKDAFEDYVEFIKGKMPGKSYMELINEFRSTFLNIDKMIIDELADLFMMVY